MPEKEKFDALNEILSRYLDNKATPEEKEFVEKYYQYFDRIDNLLGHRLNSEANEIQDRVLHNLRQEISGKGGRTVFLKSKWIIRIAAAVLICSIGLLFYFRSKDNREQLASSDQNSIQKIVPGTDKAFITLGDGSTVFLNDTTTGLIAKQGNAQVVKLSSGEVVYNTGNLDSRVFMNTLTTPKGGKFQLTLSDGTKAWLNSVSSISYPTTFTGKERNVKITGEVYFEVAKNEQLPFRVTVNDETSIRVLGTHFNVNSYADNDYIATTLLEGSVRINNKNEEQLLKPGQQAAINNNAIAVRDKVDIGQVMAWKNGYFSFDNTALTEVMKQLARWYDVNIVYEGKIPEMKFWGGMSMNSSLSEALKVLEESKVKFRVENRNIIVLSK